MGSYDPPRIHQSTRGRSNPSATAPGVLRRRENAGGRSAPSVWIGVYGTVTDQSMLISMDGGRSLFHVTRSKRPFCGIVGTTCCKPTPPLAACA